MEKIVVPGKTYAVTSAADCTVTDANGLTLATASAGKQALFVATTDTVTLSDASAVLVATFNSSPAKLRLLGLLGGGSSTGGGSVLPVGYIAAEFLDVRGRFSPIPVLEVSPNTPDFETEAVLRMSEDCFYKVNFLTNDNKQYSLHLAQGWHNAIRWMYANQELHKGEMTVDKVQTIAKKGRLNYIDDELICTNSGTISTTSMSYIGDASQSSFWALYSYKANDGVGFKRHFIPALSADGKPGLYEFETKTFYERQWCIGMNMKQALKLSKLPAGEGTLTISLPTGYESDVGVMTALETARSNGWTLTVQTYTPEAAAAASTFGMRRIWVRRTQDEHGAYVAADGTRWQVDWCVDMLTPDNSTPDAHGYELFRSVDAAVEYWELTPYVAPETENLLTETNENE